VSSRRYQEKQPYRTKVKNLISDTKKAISEGNSEKATEFAKKAVSALDRARQKNALHANNVARKKSRLLQQLNFLSKK
tara:strand:+ start:3375 stop:3608 length:234 start_codon:yes stop_codon:yes gene_type:complete